MKGVKNMLANIICFIVGAIIGGTVGVVAICCCVLAGNADERMGIK